MQEELELARPLLAEAAQDTVTTMEQIQVGNMSSETEANHVRFGYEEAEPDNHPTILPC